MIVNCITKSQFGRKDTYVVGPEKAIEAMKTLCVYDGMSERRRNAFETLGVQFQEAKQEA